MSTPARGSGSALALAALLAGAGIMHGLRPGLFEPLVPARLGAARPWVIGSGLAELACAVAVAAPRTRRAGALGSGALFVLVFPGNVQMALDSSSAARSPLRRPVVAWARLPLQVPLVVWAWRVAQAGRPAPLG